MKRKGLLSILSLALIFVFFACEQEETGKPQIDMPLSFGFSSQLKSMTSSSFEKSAAQSITFSKGHMLINELEIEAENIRDQDSMNVDFEIEKILKVNLSELQTPDTVAQVPGGEYEEIEIEMELLDHDTLSSIYMEGNFSNSQGEEIPLVFDYQDDMEFSLEGEAEDGKAIKITDQANAVGMVTFSTDSLFINVTQDELEGAQLNQDGILRISEDFNPAIYEKVVNRLEDASEAEFED